MNAHTKTYNTYDIVKVQFPFTDKDKFKKRPALVISPSKLLGAPMGTSLVAMITSVDPEKTPWKSDIFIEDLKPTNLPLASFIRFKIFTPVLCKQKSWSNFERESSLKSSTARLRKFIRINAIRMNLRSAISAALTPKLLQYFCLQSTRPYTY